MCRAPSEPSATAFIGMIGLVGQSSIILVLWYGGSLVLRERGKPGGFDAGHLMSFLLYTVNIAVALGGLLISSAQ